MAGYVISLNNYEDLKKCIRDGIYSTKMSIPTNNIWKVHHEGTFTDYLSMKQGDNIYFFHNRKIYGIGSLINIKYDCKFLNFPDADEPKEIEYSNVNKEVLWGKEDNFQCFRCLCTFKSTPHFFENGIDMDDVLSSNPSSFRMLRAFWKLSFIKIDDEENKALKDIILKRNEEYIYNKKNIFKYSPKFHKKIENKLSENHKLCSDKLLKNCTDEDKIKHEMAIEAKIVDVLSNDSKSIFGKWDYVSHQVIASPFKPIDYMDKTDVFGYKFIEGYDTISKYLVIEIKKGVAKIEDVEQLMKYVDWVKQEYAYGDYSMIKAFLVAYDFSKDTITYTKSSTSRNYTIGRRPVVSKEWKEIKLVKYRFCRNTNNLTFSEVK